AFRMQGGDAQRKLPDRVAQARLVHPGSRGQSSLLGPRCRDGLGLHRLSLRKVGLSGVERTRCERLWHCTPTPLVEGHPFHELHGEAPAGVLDEQLVKLDQVGMIYVSKRSELLLEAIDRPGVDSLQSLERNALAAQTIEHDEHRPEASPVQAMLHLE